MPKQLPCGYLKRGKLEDHLKHYVGCKHAECQKRREIFKGLIVKLKLEQVN